MSRARGLLQEQLIRGGKVEAPSVAPINMQVRTGASVPFNPYMLAKPGATEAPKVEPINMQVRTGASVPFNPYMLPADKPVEAPKVEPINMQVRTGASVPFNPYMLPADKPAEAPKVEPINMQVRTGASVPFAPHMVADAAAPEVGSINMQVRTGASVPFASYMVNTDKPAVDAINMQVRTGASVPFAGYMKGRPEKGLKPEARPVDMQVRTGASVPFNPYMLGAHAEELLKKRVMISPVLVVWQYKVGDEQAFRGWLGTREILLSEGRLGGDEELKGVRYGGTYKLAGLGDQAVFRTVWGYTSEASMNAMHRLCSDGNVSTTIVQLELIDFVKGLKAHVAAGGDQHFSQEVLVSVAAGV